MSQVGICGGLAILAWTLWMMHHEPKWKITIWFNFRDYRPYVYYAARA